MRPDGAVNCAERHDADGSLIFRQTRSLSRSHCGAKDLGLRCAMRCCFADPWASWAGAIKMVRSSIRQHRSQRERPAPWLACSASLRRDAFATPSWEDQSLESDPGARPPEIDPNQPQFGWPGAASLCVDAIFLGDIVKPALVDPSVVARSSGDAASQVRRRKKHLTTGSRQHRRCLHRPALRAPRRGAPSQRTSASTALRAPSGSTSHGGLM